MRKFTQTLSALAALILAACSASETPGPNGVEAVAVVAGEAVFGPRFEMGSDDRLVLSWMERGEDESVLKYSRLADGVFTDPVTVTTEPRMFVNWADLPSVTALDGDHWVAHWLRYSADKTYSYDVVVSQSFDNGATWTDAIPTHTDGTHTEHGFVSTLPHADGALLLWLDGRNTPDGAMTLRSAVISADNERLQEEEIDASVCDCCQTDMAIAATGPIAVYRDRTSDEIRDIYIARHLDGAWQPGARLYADDWNIAGCPVNGPSVIANDEHVAVAWFSAANDEPVVRLLTSNDSGASFGEAVEIASGRIAGYVGLAALDDGAMAVSWVGRSDTGENALFLREVSAEGEVQPAIEVGRSGHMRLFPQLAYADGYLYMAWTADEDDTSRLKTARIAVKASRHNQSS